MKSYTNSLPNTAINKHSNEHSIFFRLLKISTLSSTLNFFSRQTVIIKQILANFASSCFFLNAIWWKSTIQTYAKIFKSSEKMQTAIIFSSKSHPIMWTSKKISLWRFFFYEDFFFAKNFFLRRLFFCEDFFFAKIFSLLLKQTKGKKRKKNN